MGVTSDDYTGPSDFCHLNVHTVFSPLIGVASPDQYAERCKKFGQNAIAATEHGNMASVPDMYFACKKRGIKYIPGCFLANQSVMTTNGVKRISDIIYGDSVLTHKSFYHNVRNLQIRDYSGDLVKIKCWCLEDVLCTPEHPFLVRKVTRNEGPKGVWDEEITVDWMKAGDLERIKYNRTNKTQRSKDKSSKRRYGYYLCVPRQIGDGVKYLELANNAFAPNAQLEIDNGLILSVTYDRPGYKTTKRVNLPSRLELDDELLWIIGLWLAEGSFKNGLVFSLGGGEHDYYERIADYFAEFGIQTTCRSRIDEDRYALDITVYSCCLERLFRHYFGSGFDNKMMRSDFLSRLDSREAHFILEGLLDGDGKRLERVSYLKLNNQSLIWQARILMTKLDIPQYSAVSEAICNNSVNLSYSIHKRELGHCYYDWDDEYIYLPVYDVSREHYDGEVFNIEVDRDNSYNIGVAVHNCELYWNDYELLRRKDYKEGLNDLKRTQEDLYSRIMRNRTLTVLCKNDIGFHNLVKLTTLATKDGFFHKPRVWFDKLAEYKEGLIVLSGGMNGPASHELFLDIDGLEIEGEEHQRTENDLNTAQYIKKFRDEFGDDFYVEVQMPCMPEIYDFKIFWLLVRMADKFGVKAVITNSCYYLSAEDLEIQRVMVAIGQKTHIDDPNLVFRDTDEQWFKSRADLWSTFKNHAYSRRVDDDIFENLCDNTLEIAKRCNGLKPDTSPKIPNWGDIEKGKDADDELRKNVAEELIKRGLYKVKKKYNVDGRDVTYVDQSKIECDRFIDKGFASYFLITQDLIGFGKSKGWPFGPRGSAAGSLVCYLLGIHSIDPLKWELSFDRFMASSRGGYMLNIKM